MCGKTMKKLLFLIILAVFMYGCGIIPGGGRLFSDYHKASHYAVSGASKTKVKLDWGKPDEVIELDDGEIWIYHDRQDGKTFKFNFDKKGKLILTNID